MLVPLLYVQSLAIEKAVKCDLIMSECVRYIFINFLIFILCLIVEKQLRFFCNHLARILFDLDCYSIRIAFLLNSIIKYDLKDAGIVFIFLNFNISK